MKKRLSIVGLALVGALALVRLLGGGADREPSDPKLVLDRIWIDKLPTKPKDTLNAFVAITSQPIGIFQATTQYKGNYELFQYSTRGDVLQIVYPQTDEKEKVKARAWACKQGDMDYCLELTGASRGVKRYQSQRGWEIDGLTRSEQILDRLASIRGK